MFGITFDHVYVCDKKLLKIDLMFKVIMAFGISFAENLADVLLVH